MDPKITYLLLFGVWLLARAAYKHTQLPWLKPAILATASGHLYQAKGLNQKRDAGKYIGWIVNGVVLIGWAHAILVLVFKLVIRLAG
jgi:hypothetical protein